MKLKNLLPRRKPEVDNEIPTSLPCAIARAVSVFTKGTTLALRVGECVADTSLYSAKTLLVSTLELARRRVEAVLYKSASDTPEASKWTYRSIKIINQVSNLGNFAISVGYNLAGSTVSTASSVSQDTLHLLNGLFGSTDTSRALAAVITAMHKELGKGLGVYGPISAILYFKILQSRGARKSVSMGSESLTIWDLVISGNGESVDKHIPYSDEITSDLDLECFMDSIPYNTEFGIFVDDIITRTVKVEVINCMAAPVFKYPPNARNVRNEMASGPIETNYYLEYQLTFSISKQKKGKYNKPIVKGQGISNLANTSRVMQKPRSRSNSFVKHTDSTESDSPGRLSSRASAHDLAQYMRYSSAAYGQSFMRFFGIEKLEVNFSSSDAHHHREHYSFAHHAGLSLNDILLSTFSEVNDELDSCRVPLMLFVAVDHKEKAIVLTIRGTLGLEDILADFTFGYETFDWEGCSWKAHGGMLKRAQMLTRESNTVLVTLKAALEKYGSEYGIVICGHSLGAGVGALFGILLTEITSDGQFVTSPSASILPDGRKVRCFCYGPPASISVPLREVTKNLITSVVFGLDLVPCLSLGLLHDFQALGFALKTDTQGILRVLIRRIFLQLGRPKSVLNDNEYDEYLWSITNALRTVMQSDKLVPPGEIFHITTSTIFDTHEGRTRKATRLVGKLVIDVEKCFGEPIFGRGIFHHNPAYYERALNCLEETLN